MTQGPFRSERVKGKLPETVSEEENDGVIEVAELGYLVEENHAHTGEEQQNEEEENKEGEDVGDHARDCADERTHEAVEAEEEDDLEPETADEESEEVDFRLRHVVVGESGKCICVGFLVEIKVVVILDNLSPNIANQDAEVDDCGGTDQRQALASLESVILAVEKGLEQDTQTEGARAQVH